MVLRRGCILPQATCLLHVMTKPPAASDAQVGAGCRNFFNTLGIQGIFRLQERGNANLMQTPFLPDDYASRR